MKERLIQEIQNDIEMMGILNIVRDLSLPDCWIGAGFVRNKAWDILHGHNKQTPLSDIDVVFMDKTNQSVQHEKEIEERLNIRLPKHKWEVINQARTHLWHNRLPYKSTEKAISHWVETATCLGIRLGKNGQLELIAPHGLFDLENLILRPVPSLKDLTVFYNRIEKKRWLENWPKLKIQT